MGIRDTGTCGDIKRMIIYYTVCHAKQIGLVVYPEFGTPPKSGPDEVYEANCVCNAHNVTSLRVNAFSATSTCSDEVEGGAKCECDGGYEMAANGRSCTG